MLLAGLFGAESAIGATLARQAAPTTVSSYGGLVVWSEPSGAGYRLVSALNGSPPSPLTAAERSVPFDVDLGPDRDGRPVAVYSRCRREPPATLETYRRLVTGQLSYTLGAGCDIYRYDFGRRSERRIDSISTTSRSEVLPAIWRNRIAFVAVSNASRSRSLPSIYVRQDDERRSRRIRGGTQVSTEIGGENVGPVALDLAGGRLAFAWDLVGQDCREADDDFKFDPLTSELWLGSTSGTARRVARGCSTDPTSLLASPALSDGRLSFLRLGDDGTGTRTRQVIVGHVTERGFTSVLTDPCLLAIGRDRQVLYTVRPTGCPASGQAEFDVASQSLPRRRAR